MDSDLEAFSHYPADGSVAALPGRTTAKTNYLNERFHVFVPVLNQLLTVKGRAPSIF